VATRKSVLAIAPTYGTVEPGRDAYLDAMRLRPLIKETGRFWSFARAPTTVALDGNRYAKSLNGFSSHNTEESFRELLREYAEHGCPRPSSYADVFHEKYRSPRVNWSVNALLAPAMAGGWQQALSPGIHAGTYRRYDMRSAYLWAVTLGMPDVKTFKRSKQPWKHAEGLYRIKLLDRVRTAPFPFNTSKECLATPREIETYNLPLAEVVNGVTWRGLIEPTEILNAIRSVSMWELAGRMYWGRWAQLQKVRCNTKDKQWDLPNTSLNIPWAHTIVSRVKMRLWEASSNAVHVYVDSVITRDKLPTNSDIGSWRLEKTYENGVIIRGPGQYGDVSAERLEKMAGASINSPRRNNPVALVL
jgi:hypothetical protein